MEKRTITIANTRTQTRERFESEATTLGELKKELDDRNIDYYGMSFTEGLSKTVLIDDDSVLPSNLMYKGQRTNDLVILLTNTEKKIASGIDRNGIYVVIKTNNLQDRIRDTFGKSYTNISTADLEEFINDVMNHHCSCTSAPAPKTDVKNEVIEWFFDGVKTFIANGVLNAQDVATLGHKLAELASDGAIGGISNEDIDAMIADLY